MEVRQQVPGQHQSSPTAATGAAASSGDHHPNHCSETLDQSHNTPPARASDALPLPLFLTNGIFSTLFVCIAYFLLVRWREKIRDSIPLHVVSIYELIALLTVIASIIYLLGFFGIDFVQSYVSHSFSSRDSPPKEEANNNHNHLSEKTDIQLNRLFIQDSRHTCTYPKDITSPLSDEETVEAVISGTIPSHALESELKDRHRAAAIRRAAVERMTGKSLDGLPLEGFDYESIMGRCCEMPVGYVQIPVGIAGPLVMDEREFFVPMATTEGCLVASTNRGCKAISLSGGAFSVVFSDGMTRAPVVRFGSARRAAQLKVFLEDPVNFDAVSVVFNSSSRFARLQSVKCAIAGKNLYIRFCCSTGDAMGMNMVSKGVQYVLNYLKNDLFPDMDIIGLSGNYCSDKKPSAVNWIEGRGKSVVSEAIILEEVVSKVLKTSVKALVELNTLKNLAGSAVAGSVGGFNAHASNVVTAIYIATGQDPAQNVESSNCITMMETINDGKDLHVSVTMPSIEVGTIGGGTELASQSACLNLLGVKGGSTESPGANSRLLARIVAGAVLAGELSLMSAIAEGQLVKSHMKYNRSSKDVAKMDSS